MRGVVQASRNAAAAGRVRRVGLRLAIAGFALWCLAGLGWTSPAVAAPAEDAVAGPTPPEPPDYKMDGYRSPTPATLAGARVLDTAAAEAAWRDKSVLLIDVMPRPEKPANLPAGTIWRDHARDHIPGTPWLVNVGYGKLSPDMSRFFADSLTALTGGDKAKPIAFYCRAACWMSWNAAKRAMEWGYQRVGWYPEGTDGWEAAELPLEPATPYRLDTPPAGAR
ncbi:rhodanese-related sulfurtransferase [Methylopila sp. Yamaguchi]|uniref:rhodanese-like domain-containing protein n=1 Tax=Methylopila sp. Yamaguchi TaxID=1437817 RepID=UPI000CAA6350|nr:rhodanese-like domain-containing protein [Methylopila sp. Yamaguchi]GBD50053.1 rhodanese-related sulfurtransferase [Methylopila sp. Yamaguchi]